MTITRAETQPGQRQMTPEEQWEQLMQTISEILKDPIYKNNLEELIFLRSLIEPTVVKIGGKKGPQIEVRRSPLEILARAWGYEIPHNLEDLITPQEKIEDKNLLIKPSPQEPIINKDKPASPQAPDLNLPEQ